MPVIALALLVVTGAAAVDASLSDAGVENDITNEEFDASTTGVKQLNQSNLDGVRYDDVVTVRNDKDRQVVAGEDYRWNESNGTIEVLSGGDLVGSNQATIDYSYTNPTDSQQDVGALFASGFDILALLFLLLAVGAVLGTLGRFT